MGINADLKIQDSPWTRWGLGRKVGKGDSAVGCTSDTFDGEDAILLEDTVPLDQASSDNQTKVDQAQIAWLKSQIGKIGLVDSYEGDETDKAYLYDQALAAIAFTQAGEIDKAKAIFKALSSLQRANGSWQTCYLADTGSACESTVHTGPIAWVVMAINFYEAKTGDKQFSSMADKALGWMDTMIIASGETKGALQYGEGEQKISAEHNQDAYSAYFYRGQKEKAEKIKHFLITEMWAPSPESNRPYHNVSVFWRGFNEDPPVWCTDPQSWGVLALGADYAKSLDWLDQEGFGFGSTKSAKQGVTGFSFCTEDNNTCGKNPFVWLEGTEQVAAAYYSIGDTDKGDYYHSQTKKAVIASGGIPYTIGDAGETIGWPCNWNYGSVASTAWFYFNEAKINPFNPQIK